MKVKKQVNPLLLAQAMRNLSPKQQRSLYHLLQGSEKPQVKVKVKL